jgi:hypothetical protein
MKTPKGVFSFALIDTCTRCGIYDIYCLYMERGFKPNRELLGDNLKARDETVGFLGTHDSDLYDQDEDRAGERRNLATGSPIDNSSEVPGTPIIHSTLKRTVGEDALPPEVGFDDDAAANWLKENDTGL